jgi:hypothetical protein
MDLLVERIRLRNPSSFVHGPIPRRAVLGATFAKSKKPVSLFQGYHQRTKHVGSDFRLIPHRGRDTAEHTVKRCSELEANATHTSPNHALNSATAHQDLEAMVCSEVCPSLLDLMQLFSRFGNVHSRLVAQRQIGFFEPFRVFLQITLCIPP